MPAFSTFKVPDLSEPFVFLYVFTVSTVEINLNSLTILHISQNVGIHIKLLFFLVMYIVNFVSVLYFGCSHIYHI